VIRQNGREKYIKIEAFINAIAQGVIDAQANMASMNAMDQALLTKADQAALDILALQMADKAEQTALANLAAAMPNISVPQGGIANPSALVSLNILGVGVAVDLNSVNALRNTVIAILAALRTAKILNATPV